MFSISVLIFKIVPYTYTEFFRKCYNTMKNFFQNLLTSICASAIFSFSSASYTADCLSGTLLFKKVITCRTLLGIGICIADLMLVV